MLFYSSAICDTGFIRTENQDNCYINGMYRANYSDAATFRHSCSAMGDGLYAVADGMGGESNGGLASYLAVRDLAEVDTEECRGGVMEYLIRINKTICDLTAENGWSNMGSTFAGIAVRGRMADITNIGDSRAYLLRDTQLRQLSRDHSVAQQMLDLGVVDGDGARTHPGRRELTQHLGISASEMIIEPYFTQIEIEEGDIFLLCSDGLTDMLIDSEIRHILNTADYISQKADMLFRAALQKGGKDNITVILMQAEEMA